MSRVNNSCDRLAAHLLTAAFLLGVTGLPALAGEKWVPVNQDVTLAADRARVWNDGDLRFVLLQGKCFIENGLYRVRSRECLAWMNRAAATNGKPLVVRLIASGDVRVETGGRGVDRKSEHYFELTTTARLRLEAEQQLDASGADHPLFAAAVKRIGSFVPSPDQEIASDSDLSVPSEPDQIKTVQFSGTEGLPPGSVPPQPGVDQPSLGQTRLPNMPTSITPRLGGGGSRDIRVSRRSSQDFQAQSFQAENGEQVVIFTGGIRLTVETIETGEVVTVIADSAVLWTRQLPGQMNQAGFKIDKNQPVELYLEGNVYVRQGNLKSLKRSDQTVLEGKQVYFNVNTNEALVIDGAVETYDDQFGTPLIMRATQIRQLTPDKFFAKGAGFTTSPYRGTPGYEFTARDVYFDVIKQRLENPFTGEAIIDSETGEQIVRERQFVTGYQNLFRVADVPIFYWPYLRADVQDPLGPLEDLRFGNTDNLGVTGTAVLDVWQLIGLDYLPIAEQTNWLADVGYYSRRGPAGGSRFDYFGNDLFGLPGEYYGNTLAWAIHDDGDDRLGRDRFGLVPPRKSRNRLRLQHRQELPNDFTLITEFSYLSDENMLESFFETEYDYGKDQDTLIYLKQQRDSWAWTGLFQPRVNDFLPQNPWQPRLDGYLLGIPLLENRLTYYQHSSIGYGSLRPPEQLLLATDQTYNTGRIDTRHELNLPLNVGPVRFSPFVIGQLSGYTQATQADGLGRIYAAGGFRSSFPFWKLYPNVQSRYLNLSGLAHKIAINVDYFNARSNRDFTELPLLDQLDDDTSELVRRRTLLRQFGGVAPLRYDTRFIALRRNLNYYPEILDDMHNFRFGLKQKLQTKRGPIGGQRIIDFMVLDLGASVFPESNRDNLGEAVGLVDVNYRWNLGDRTAIRSTVLHEPFDDTVQWTSVMVLQRPPRAQLQLFYSYFDSGPFKSNYVGFSNSYRFSKKYAGVVSAGVDLDSTQNLSYELGFTRVGLDFLLTIGIVYNAGREDFGFQVDIIPRVGARTRLNRARLRTLPFGVDSSESPVIGTDDRLSPFNNSFTTY